MSWNQLTSAAVKFTPAELNMLQAAQGATTGLSGALTATIKKFQGAIAAAGYDSMTDGLSVPDQLRDEVLAFAVWIWLRDFPTLAKFQTEWRKNAYLQAQATYEGIVKRTYGAIESPFGTDSGTSNWNSNTKIIGRMGPIPSPTEQMSPFPVPLYANVNAPPDAVASNVPAIPPTPVGFVLTPGNGYVFAEWAPTPGAATYNLYRGTISGQETLFQQNLTKTYYMDNSVTNSVQYVYYVKAQNVNGLSPASLELAVTPLATIPP